MWRCTSRTMLGLLEVFKNEDGIPDGFYFYDFNGKVNYDASPNDRLSLSLYLGTDALDLEFLEDAVRL